MKAPSVSGATKYRELCVAAKNEEKRQAELRRRQQYSKSTHSRQPQIEGARNTANSSQRRPATSNPSSGADAKKCFLCKKPGHLMRDCRTKKPENTGSGRPTATKQVTINALPDGGAERPNPYDLLFSSDSEDEEAVRQIRVTDQGSKSQHARVIVHGVPADDVIDTGADITIMGQ